MADTLDASLLQQVKARLLTEYPMLLQRCLQALGEDDLWWRPHEGANAVGNLVLHLCGSNRYFLEHVVGGEPNVRDREAEFAARGGISRADIEQTWSDVVARVTGVLDRLSVGDLQRVTSDRGRSVAEILLHVTHHNALHVGQIVWVTKMRRPEAF